MAGKFKGPELVKAIDRALNKGLARFVFNTQSKLAAAAPIDTGRLASSWFIGMDQPNREVEPERDEPEGVQVTRDYTALEITMQHNWYISSNLPYTERACYDARWAKGGRRGGAQWFTNIANRLPQDAERSFDYFLKNLK
nr:hypothetical protein [uncultured Mediterranean phage uvMED]